MREKSMIKKEKTDFTEQIPEYNDDEILTILKKRKYYQQEAARLAIDEALKRKLINSEDDLLAFEFQVKPLKKSLFPKIEDRIQKKKISKSISRGLLITGIIPVIYGMLKMNEGNQIEGGLVTFGGALWMIFASQTIRKANQIILNLFFALLLVASIYLARLLFQLKTIVFMDLFIVAVVFSLTVYGVLYLKRLHA